MQPLLFVGALCWSLFRYTLLCVHKSFEIILTRKRPAMLLCFNCLSDALSLYVSVLWLFLTVLWVGVQCVIVVFPDNTHLLFL